MVAGGEHDCLLHGMGVRQTFTGSWGITVGYITIVALEAVPVPRTVEYIFPGLSRIQLGTVAEFEVNLTSARLATFWCAAAVLATSASPPAEELAVAATAAWSLACCRSYCAPNPAWWRRWNPARNRACHDLPQGHTMDAGTLRPSIFDCPVLQMEL